MNSLLFYIKSHRYFGGFLVCNVFAIFCVRLLSVCQLALIVVVVRAAAVAVAFVAAGVFAAAFEFAIFVFAVG